MEISWILEVFLSFFYQWTGEEYNVLLFFAITVSVISSPYAVFSDLYRIKVEPFLGGEKGAQPKKEGSDRVLTGSTNYFPLPIRSGPDLYRHNPSRWLLSGISLLPDCSFHTRYYGGLSVCMEDDHSPLLVWPGLSTNSIPISIFDWYQLTENVYWIDIATLNEESGSSFYS